MALSNLSVNFNSMLDRIISMQKKVDKTHELHLQELKQNIEHTKSELLCAMENFNNVTEPKLIDFYIYKIQSEQTKYDQLICEYKLLNYN